ncbi:MAG TPA: putative quinol monooxygenase [Alphaproteobacteria bacterium]|nr:putative quinol monooxygenase [Alphaproteobacteria bacterium]
MARLYVFARFHARTGREDAAAAAIRKVAGPTRAEPGCLVFHAFRSTRDKCLFYIHSTWRHEAAFERHAALPHTVRFLAEMERLIDRPREVTRTTKLL